MNKIIRLAPTIFISIFLILYVTATFYYAGGSQHNQNSTSFHWFHNYWCDLLNEYSYVGGIVNSSRPIAITGMIFLSLSVGLLFVLFPKNYPINPFWNFVIRYIGALAMFVAFFISTPYHDAVTIVSSLLALLPLIGIYVGLLKNKKKRIFYAGLLCLILLIANNLIYYSNKGIYYLPFLQKLSFLFILGWFIIINLSFLKSNSITQNM